jgi:hypothetical protein
MANRRVGYIPCDGSDGCGNPERTVDETPTGSLSINCHRCGRSGFARPGSANKRKVQAVMTPAGEDGAPTPKAPQAPEPKTPAPAPAPAARPGLLMG